MGLHLGEIYRSPNVGVFLKTNDKHLLIPKGFAETKTRVLADNLQVSPLFVSIAGSRLLGPLVVMNNNGILVSRLTEDYEMQEIASKTGLRVERLASRYTAVGNLVAANDRGAIVSQVLEAHAVRQIRDVLGTEVERMAIDQYIQVGSLIVTTDSGAAVYPSLREDAVEQIGAMLGVEAAPASVNGGIPYVASGVVANSRNAIAGNLTTGPELIFLTKALNV